MKIKVKNQVFVNGYMTALDNLAVKELNPFSSLSLIKFIRELSEHSADYHKARLKLVEEYALKGEDDKPVVADGKFELDPERLEEFNEKFMELLQIEIEVELMKKITLPKDDSFTILPNDALLLEDILNLE